MFPLKFGKLKIKLKDITVVFTAKTRLLGFDLTID